MKRCMKLLWLQFLSVTCALFANSAQQPNMRIKDSQNSQQAAGAEGTNAKTKGLPLPFPENEGEKITLQDGTTLWFSVQNQQFVLCCLNENGEMIPAKVAQTKISYRQNSTSRSVSNGSSQRPEVAELSRNGNYLSSTKRVHPPYTFSNITLLWSETEKPTNTFTKKPSRSGDSETKTE